MIDVLRIYAEKYMESEQFIHNVCKTIQFVTTNTKNKYAFIVNGEIKLMKQVLSHHSVNPFLHFGTSMIAETLSSA